MNISLVYADPRQPLWLELEVEEGSTVADAITQSRIGDKFPAVDFSSLKTGVFGKLAQPGQALKPGDRVEIYSPICVDPKTVKRRDRD